MAYDKDRNCVVLFAGREAGSSLSLDDTWEYAGATWRETQKIQTA